MPNLGRESLGLLLALGSVVFGSPAFCHGPVAPLPLHHLAVLSRPVFTRPAGHLRPFNFGASTSKLSALQLASFLKGPARFSFVKANSILPPGYNGLRLSGSSRAVINQLARITSNGLFQGEQLGTVQFGQLNGQLEFEQVNGNVYASDGAQINIFGNSPLNMGPMPGSFTIPNPGQNLLVFAPTPSVGPQMPGAPHLKVANLVSLSGASRGFINEYKYLTRTSFSTGQNLVSHPIGGEFAGTSYDGIGNRTPDSLFVAAFGNNPLNIPGLPNNSHVTIPNPMNYLQLSNGKTIFLHGGQILSTEYDTLLPNGQYRIEGYSLFAFGNNPYNTGKNGPSVFIDPNHFVSFIR